jgi:hypothetical protein
MYAETTTDPISDMTSTHLRDTRDDSFRAHIAGKNALGLAHDLTEWSMLLDLLAMAVARDGSDIQPCTNDGRVLAWKDCMRVEADLIPGVRIYNLFYNKPTHTTTMISVRIKK